MSTPPRSTPAQQGPPPNLADLPTSAPQAGSWFREHAHRAGVDAGCWYYAPLPANPTLGGRFDLPAPEGTCYFANAAVVAAMERVGVFTAAHKPIPADIVEGRVVSEVPASDLPATAGNLLALVASTDFGVTGELFAMEDYSVPQAWARASYAAGHAALVYTPRFSPFGQAIAVFGPQGARPHPTTRATPLSEVLTQNHITYERIPPVAEMTFHRVP